jgi:hypothetical protein
MIGKVCVLLDANSWFSERLLRSGMGAAVIICCCNRSGGLDCPRAWNVKPLKGSLTKV